MKSCGPCAVNLLLFVAVAFQPTVTKHVPGFEMLDPYVTRELTVHDLLTHHSGLERGDMLGTDQHWTETKS